MSEGARLVIVRPVLYSALLIATWDSAAAAMSDVVATIAYVLLLWIAGSGLIALWLAPWIARRLRRMNPQAYPPRPPAFPARRAETKRPGQENRR